MGKRKEYHLNVMKGGENGEPAGSKGFYNRLNFVEFNDLRYYLDRDQIERLKKTQLKIQNLFQ